MSLLTLSSLLDPRPVLTNGEKPGRIRLMRHAFRGHKEQLKKLEKWTGGIRLTPDQAYPGDTGKPSSEDVLNAVRLDRRLARLVSSDQSAGTLMPRDLILAFAATGGPSAEFLAAFEVQESIPWEVYFSEFSELLVRPPRSARNAGLENAWLGRGLGYNALPREDGALFRLVDREDILEGLERRLVVEWKSGVSWFQKELKKEVLEIRPKGFVREFTGLLDFTLSFDELRAVVGVEANAAEVANTQRGLVHGDPVWREQLSRVSGVYIVQSDEGPLYVGAAYGSRGFLGRWSHYAKTNYVSTGPEDCTGLRGNVGLKRFLDADGDHTVQTRRLRGLKLSIAHVMDRSAREQEVLDMEKWFKAKLGTRARHLHLNAN